MNGCCGHYGCGYGLDRLSFQVLQPGLPAAGHTGSSMTGLSLGLQGKEAMRPCEGLRQQGGIAGQPELALMITA